MEVALVAIATLAGATLQSATGFGFALLLGPVAFAVFEPVDAVFILLTSGALLSFLVLFAEQRPREAQVHDLRPILAAAVVGMVGGVFVLAALKKDLLQVLVGVGVLLAVALQMRAAPTHAAPPPTHPGALHVGTGLVTGLLTTTTSTNGPPLVLLFQRLGYRPAEQRDSLASAFLFLDLIGAIIVVPLLLDSEGVSAAALLAIAACTFGGQELGRRIFVRLHPRAFRIAGLLLVTVAGLASIVAGFVA